MELTITEADAGDLSIRSILDAAQHENTITIAKRYGKPVGVVVPYSWYQEASHGIPQEPVREV
jgi:hypothetical protein